MAQTVNAAFDEFLSDKVNLDKDRTKTARASKGWLFEQIASFQSDATFPKSYSEHDIHYGSFARKTKIRPINDIDLMVCLSAQGASYWEQPDKGHFTRRMKIEAGARSASRPVYRLLYWPYSSLPSKSCASSMRGAVNSSSGAAGCPRRRASTASFASSC